MFKRSRRNLARWFTLSMGMILVVIAGVIYYQKVVEQLEAIDSLLYKKAKVMASSIQCEDFQKENRIDLSNVPLLGNNPPPPDTEVVFARWYDASGNLKQFFGLLPQEKLDKLSEFETVKIIDTTSNSGALSSSEVVWLRQITLPIYHQRQIIGYLQMAIPMIASYLLLQEFLLHLILIVIMALIITSVTGWFLGGLAMQPIRESYQQLQRFTANASHELRTPLAAVLSNAQVGLLAPMDNAASKHQRLQKIVEITKSMNALVGNLLLLARRTGNLSSESLQDIDLTYLLTKLLDSQTTIANAKHLILKSDLPSQPVIVRGDPDLLSQVVTNLLSNACKYTPAGGTINLRLQTHFRFCTIEVEDNGVGIAAADLPHIFERFYRVDKERSRSTGSFGLGLAIALAIVEAHNGHLSVRSQVGKGSVFKIELPLKSVN
jgi:signal transduction histidine kinase